MTAPTPDLPNDALSAEERAFAAQLARLDAGAGPSAALDARILAAARAAQAPRPARTPRRWPAMAGSAAILVATLGLAWQLSPMFELPPPRAETREQAARDGDGMHEADVVVAVEPVQPRAAPPVDAAIADAAAPATAPAPTAQRQAAPSSVPRLAVAPPPSPAAKRAEARAATGNATEAIAADAAAAAPTAASAAPQAEDASTLDRVSVTGSRVRRPGPVPSDYAMLPAEWLERIRERRSEGDVEGARESLRRFVLENPHVEVPEDLRDLLTR
ncbi:hypothetical protein [Lysobacter humi (ex Lee et al. 2017)]